MRLFDRSPSQQAEIYADAQALIDDGLDRDFVLELYGSHAEWLAPMLTTAGAISTAAAAEPPSYFFEASLKAKFLAAGAAAAREASASDAPRPPAYVPAPAAGPVGHARAILAGSAFVAAAAAFGALVLGFVTAGNAGPGDWNYSLKLAQERLQYTLASGDQRIDIQLGQTEARVYELQRQAQKGTVSEGDIERLRREADELAQLVKAYDLDNVQKARVKSIGEQSAVVLGDVRQRQAALEPKVETTIETVNSAMGAAGVGSIASLPPATAPADASATPSATGTPPADATTTPSPVATEEPTQSATVVPTADPTESPTPTTTPDPTEEPTETPTPTASPDVSPSPSPSPSASPDASPEVTAEQQSAERTPTP